MKHFESAGLWSLAADFSSTIAGTLQFDVEGLNLRLLGSFQAQWGSERYPTIYGILGENPYGTFVTLIECVRKHCSFSPGGLSFETIWCSRGVIGASYLAETPHHFQTLELQLSYLQYWAVITGIEFEVSGQTQFTGRYTTPEPIQFQVAEKSVSLASSPMVTRGLHHVNLEEQTRILIEPVGELSPRELGGGCIPVLQNLLTFATDTPNAVEGITYCGAPDHQGLKPEYHLVFEPTFRVKEEKKSLHASDMLFTLRDAQDRGVDVLRSWYEFTQRNQAFCTVYFANLYAEPRYINDRFTSLMHAFTLLIAETAQTSERTKAFVRHVEAALKSEYTDEERVLLEHIIPTDLELETPFRLARLLDENKETMGTLIDDVTGFVSAVCDTLDYFKRRPDRGQPPLHGTALLYAMLKIRTLVKIVILKDLGFDENAVRSLIMRNKKISFLRAI